LLLFYSLILSKSCYYSPTLCYYSHIILNKWSKNIVNACYTAASVNSQHSLAGWGPVVIWKKSLLLRKHAWQQWQINYTICALICARASVATVSHFHHLEQTGSLFSLHPLLPHGNTCYYSRIILNSLPLLLISQNYSGIIIAGLPEFVRTKGVVLFLMHDESVVYLNCSWNICFVW